jgi:hypothetical protein
VRPDPLGGQACTVPSTIADLGCATVFDQRSGTLYVSLRQTFSVWFVPFYRAPVKLVTVLQLTQRSAWDSSEPVASRAGSLVEGREPAALAGPGQERARYYIASQDDLYQANECFQFLLPGLGPLLWFVWQMWATGMCVAGSLLFLPMYLLLNRQGTVKAKTT